MIHVDRGHLRNALELFFLWSGRLEAQRLEMQRKEIDKNLENIQDKFIKPLGT